MAESRPELFRGRHFQDEIIVLCVRWYLRYPLSYCNVEEIMAKRGLPVRAYHSFQQFGSSMIRDSLILWGNLWGTGQRAVSQRRVTLVW